MRIGIGRREMTSAFGNYQLISNKARFVINEIRDGCFISILPTIIETALPKTVDSFIPVKRINKGNIRQCLCDCFYSSL